MPQAQHKATSPTRKPLVVILEMTFMMNYSLSRPAKERQGQYPALYSISYGLANVFATLLVLGIADRFGFATMFYFFIGLSLLTAVGFWLLKRWDGKSLLLNDPTEMRFLGNSSVLFLCRYNSNSFPKKKRLCRNTKAFHYFK